MAIVKLKIAPPSAAGPIADGILSLEDLKAFIRAQQLEGAPIDVIKVAEQLGIEVRPEQMDDDMSGYLERRGDRWAIGVNQYHHPVRQRFTVAHELAHFALHRATQARFDDVTFARRAEAPNKMEREADRFAAELLMPRESVSSAVNRGIRNLNALASTFSVSTIAMKYRLRDLGYQLT